MKGPLGLKKGVRLVVFQRVRGERREEVYALRGHKRSTMTTSP